MRFFALLFTMGLLFTGCWFAFEKVDASDTGELRVEVKVLEKTLKAERDQFIAKESALLLQQESRKKTLKTLFQKDAEIIDRVFAPVQAPDEKTALDKEPVLAPPIRTAAEKASDAKEGK